MKQPLLLFLLLAFLLSCTREIEIDYPGGQENLVLNSVLQPDEQITARVNRSQPYENMQSPPYLQHARIEVFEDGKTLGVMAVCERSENTVSEQPGDSIYTYCLSSGATEGKNYRLVASVPELPGVEATTTLPAAAAVSITQLNEAESKISFNIKDDPSVKNYYIFEVVGRDFSADPAGYATQSISTNDLTIEMLGETFDVVVLPYQESAGTHAFVDDHYFNGKTKKVELGCFFTSGEALLKVYSCSKDYYEYFRTSLLSDSSNSSPFKEPYRVYSNVSNGYGVVAGFSLSVLPL